MPTGIVGLDQILGGGLVKGATYIVQGRPGAGKTIFANQACFRHASAGGNSLYITLLAESHARLLQNLSTLEFYDPAQVPSRIYYISGHTTLRDGGLNGLIALMRAEIARKKSTLLVLDGLLNVRETAATGIDLKLFLQELQSHADFAGCTVLLLTSAALDSVSPEHTMVDGVFELTEDLVGVRAMRRLVVRKLRGSGNLRGQHLFEITSGGLRVYPRLEALLAKPSRPDATGASRIASGLPELDAMVGGGLPAPAVTLLLGASGTGKTSVGLHFLAQASDEEPALHFGFNETPPRLVAKAAALGLDLAGPISRGQIEVIWQPATEALPDAMAYRMLDAIERRGIKRVFLDGIAGLQRALVDPGRLDWFLTALANELRARGVSTLATWEVRGLVSPDVTVPSDEIASVVDTLMLLRHVEGSDGMRRVLWVLKAHGSAHDCTYRDLRISDRGVALIAPRGPAGVNNGTDSA